MKRKRPRPSLYKVMLWWVVDVEDPEKYDARDAVEYVMSLVKGKPNGYKVGPARRPAAAKEE